MTAAKFTQASGVHCIVDFSLVSDVSLKPYGKVFAEIEFQCNTVENVPGLVYVSVMLPKKRKPRSFAVHQDTITLV